MSRICSTDRLRFETYSHSFVNQLVLLQGRGATLRPHWSGMGVIGTDFCQVHELRDVVRLRVVFRLSRIFDIDKVYRTSFAPEFVAVLVYANKPDQAAQNREFELELDRGCRNLQ